MYLRLFIPEVLSDYDKAIYLDCDTIIQADISELYEMDFEDNYICAARDYNSIVNIAYYPKVNYYFTQMLNFETMDNYINSGVLLMNLPKLRDINLPEKTFELLEKHKELLYPDQDIINLICKDKIKIIHNGWNFVFGINAALVHDNKFINMAVDWSKGLADQRIIHYISDQKPWNVPEMSYADIWWKYAKLCPIYQSLLKDYFDANPDKLKD
jgi:lipopolysaccharide biosynthesis glycosyltransferase